MDSRVRSMIKGAGRTREGGSHALLRSTRLITFRYYSLCWQGWLRPQDAAGLRASYVECIHPYYLALPRLLKVVDKLLGQNIGYLME
jgi:hypothetical protein